MILLATLLAFVLFSSAQPNPAPSKPPTTQPTMPKILIYSQTAGYKHDAIPLGKTTLAELATSAGLEPVISDDAHHFNPDQINQFKVIAFNNTSGEVPLSPEQRESLINFVRSGGGFIGIHAASDTLYQFPAYGDMLGAYFDGHPWNAGSTVTIKVEDPSHPIAKPFGSEPFQLTDEIYQFRTPYDRSKLRVLLSLDTSKTDMKVDGIKRTDGDFALAWVKPFGQGRVFYSAFGHNHPVWQDPRIRAHLLAGIHYAARTPQGVNTPDSPK